MPLFRRVLPSLLADHLPGTDGGRGPIRLWLDRLRDSFWFVPTIMAVVAGLAGILVPYLDQWLASRDALILSLTVSAGPSGARGILQSIAGSSITVTATVFSITVATLALTSGQFGPRLLRTFVSDRGIQVSMGSFLASFIFPLLLLRSIRSAGEESGADFVPQVGVTLSIGLAVVAVGVLIYFVHHLSLMIRAPYVIETVGAELDGTIDEMLPPKRGDARNDKLEPYLPAPERADRVVVARSESAGYIAYIETDSLLKLAKKYDVVLWTLVGAGHYV